MLFYDWLCRQRNREDSTGDLARDAFWNERTPKQSGDIDTWRDFCRKEGSPFSVSKLDQAWEEHSEYSDS